VAWSLAAICALGTLLLVSLDSERRRRRFIGTLSRARRAVHPADGVILLLLLIWWVVSPAFDDDGWVVTRQRMFDSSGGFSNYFDTLGANLPLDYWLEWLQHF